MWLSISREPGSSAKTVKKVKWKLLRKTLKECFGIIKVMFFFKASVWCSHGARVGRYIQVVPVPIPSHPLGSWIEVVPVLSCLLPSLGEGWIEAVHVHSYLLPSFGRVELRLWMFIPISSHPLGGLNWGCATSPGKWYGSDDLAWSVAKGANCSP